MKEVKRPYGSFNAADVAALKQSDFIKEFKENHSRMKLTKDELVAIHKEACELVKPVEKPLE